MAFNLKNRSFLKEIDFEPREMRFLLDLSQALKTAKYAGTEVKRIEGKEIALIFEKTSTRTRSAFEVAAFDQGAHVGDQARRHARTAGRRGAGRHLARAHGEGSRYQADARRRDRGRCVQRRA